MNRVKRAKKPICENCNEKKPESGLYKTESNKMLCLECYQWVSKSNPEKIKKLNDIIKGYEESTKPQPEIDKIKIQRRYYENK